MNLIIPLIKSKWCEEIKFALRSWDKYYTQDLNVFILGDYKPDWLTNVEHISIKQNGFNTEQNIALAFKYAADNFSEFIWSNDDIYLLDYLTYDDLKVPYYLQDLSGIKNRKANRWGKLLWKTIDRLIEDDKTLMNGETHTPYYYEGDKVNQVFERYGIDKGDGLLRTAYLNNFYTIDEMFDIKDKKIGFYNQRKIENGETKGKIFLNHDDNGLCDDVKLLLSLRFPNKSKYEK
jgi:hypothetical protein